MVKKKILIYGVGRLAEYAGYVFDNDTDYEVVGYCIENTYKQNHFSECNNSIVFENIEDEYSMKDTSLFIAVGNNLIRERIFSISKKKGYKLATYISTKAITWDNLEVGENCFIGEGSVIQPFVKILDNVILFAARIGHHSTIEKHSLLSGTSLAGNVSIGEYSFLGINSIVQQNIKIGAKNIIGMGVVVKNTTPDKAVFSSGKFIKKDVNFDDVSNKYLN